MKYKSEEFGKTMNQNFYSSIIKKIGTFRKYNYFIGTRIKLKKIFI